MTDQPTCHRCGRPVVDQSYVCVDDRNQLAGELATVVKVAGEATNTIAGSPLVWGLVVGEMTWVGANTLTTWARHCAESRGNAGPVVRGAMRGPVCTWVPDGCQHTTCRTIRGRRAEHPMAVVASWLTDQLNWLRHRPEAAEAFDEIDHAARLIVRYVDRRPDRWYAGPCGAQLDGRLIPCEQELEPVAGAKVIHCPNCGAEHDAQARKEWLLDQAEDQLAGAAWIAATLTRLGRPVAASTVRKWGDRGRLLEHGHDTAGRPLYRLSEVRELVLDAARRKVLQEVAAARKAIERANKERETMSA